MLKKSYVEVVMYVEAMLKFLKMLANKMNKDLSGET